MTVKKPATQRSRKITWEKQLAEDFAWLRTTQEGRRILAWMFGWGQVFQEIAESDPIKLAMAVGENNFAKRIARYVNMPGEAFTDALRANDDVAREMLGDDGFREQMRSYLGVDITAQSKYDA